ncbi:hypothetical protein ACFQW6_19200 [Nocardioides sp. GCM10028917]|jgi:hypothetical protein|uniref:hypothetical protein n=1 Tax=Nocardioides sp. GCM10028917 TaxID=3273408 RepID=UPI00360A61C8
MLRSTLATAAVALVLAGCGGEDPESGATSAVTSTPTATPTPSPPADAPLPCVPGAEPFTGPAAEEFGAEQVMAAYCMLADLALEQTRTSLALPVPEQDGRDLRSVRVILTDAARRKHDDLTGLTLHDVSRVPRGYRRADDLPHVFGTRVGPATADLDGQALVLAFDLQTGLVLEERGDDSGRHLLLPVTRSGRYVLVPDGDGWLVDDWRASFEQGQVGLVSGWS